jgi:phosphatidylglycerophosphate synthase
MLDASFEPLARRTSAWVALVMLVACLSTMITRSTWLLSLAGPAVLGVMLVQLGDYSRRGSWLPNAFTFARVLVTAWLARIGAQLTGPSLSTAVLLVLIMDGLDGLVARGTNTHSAQGAQFDAESDAFVMLTVCVIHVLRGLSPWVLSAGLVRYAYVLAIDYFGLSGITPRSTFERSAAVLSVSALTFAFAPLGLVSKLLVVASTLLMSLTFGSSLYTALRTLGSSARTISATSRAT